MSCEKSQIDSQNSSQWISKGNRIIRNIKHLTILVVGYFGIKTIGLISPTAPNQKSDLAVRILEVIKPN